MEGQSARITWFLGQSAGMFRHRYGSTQSHYGMLWDILWDDFEGSSQLILCYICVMKFEQADNKSE